MAGTDAPEKVPVFNFMMVRAPEPVDPEALRRHYIRDQVLVASKAPMTHIPPDLDSVEHFSVVGKLIYQKVFCSAPKPVAEAMEDLLEALLGLLIPWAPVCDEGNNRSTNGQSSTDGVDEVRRREGSRGRSRDENVADVRERGGGEEPMAESTEGPVATTIEPEQPESEHRELRSAARLLIRDLERYAYIRRDGYYYILPDRMEQLTAVPLISQLIRALPVLESERPKLDRQRLVRRLETNFDGRLLQSVVFDSGQHSSDYIQAKRALFDALYLLYLLRRWTTVNLEHIIAALRVLHALEALAIDQVYDRARAGLANNSERALLAALAGILPPLQGWDLKTVVPGFPLVADEVALEEYLSATPIVHPIFARLFWYAKPFNEVKPIGVGDLKVVKQWLRGYKLGEIAHVDNVLLGETKSRVHRHLEKAEDVLSFASEQQEETQRDTQTTDRFELKREAEEVIKSDLTANAGFNISLSTEGPYKIVSSVNGSFAYARSQTEQDKVASNFAHDVVDKAVKRIQSRVSQQRTATRIFETEERNTHTFDNKGGKEHISGLYRWLDKEYRSRIYNYGKRMMFEFVLPEPAAFLVESRLRAFEATLDVPKPPSPPTKATLPTWVTDLTPASIDEKKFRELKTLYDLGELTFPTLTKRVEFVDSATGKNYFSERGMDSSTWQGRTFTCRLNAKNYRITKLIVDGYVKFYGTGEAKYPSDFNTLEIYVDGQRYYYNADNNAERWYFGPNAPGEFSVAGALPLVDDQASLFLGFWDIEQFDLSLHAELELSPAVLADWQAEVCAKVRAIEQKNVDEHNTNLMQSYESQLSTYRNRLGELRATAMHDILQGQSEAFNRQMILQELKRQCLVMLTKDFDADPSDDTISKIKAIGSRTTPYHHHQFEVDELPNPNSPTKVSVKFKIAHEQIDFPAVKISSARRKGRYVQFLEQAFEWQQLAYICYPYFWSSPPSWVELMNRSDDTDPFLSAFLQAGSVKVLLAVSPAYDDAVLHYLATGEPWDGGPAPVIGDPLYVPLYEELRKQQDDLANASPTGQAWTFTLPTSLVYLENSSSPLPPLAN